MSDSSFSKKLITFIVEHFHSVEQLEVLLLLFAHKDREWTVEEISRQMRSSDGSITIRTDELCAQGFLSVSDGPQKKFRYSARDREQDEMITQLEEQYSIRRLRVIDAIYSAGTHKMLTVLNAFKVNQEDDDG